MEHVHIEIYVCTAGASCGVFFCLSVLCHNRGCEGGSTAALRRSGAWLPPHYSECERIAPSTNRRNCAGGVFRSQTARPKYIDVALVSICMGNHKGKRSILLAAAPRKCRKIKGFLRFGQKIGSCRAQWLPALPFPSRLILSGQKYISESDKKPCRQSPDSVLLIGPVICSIASSLIVS